MARLRRVAQWRVLIAGGEFQKLEVYDPASGKFQFAGKLDDVNRCSHTDTLMGDASF